MADKDIDETYQQNGRFIKDDERDKRESEWMRVEKWILLKQA